MLGHLPHEINLSVPQGAVLDLIPFINHINDPNIECVKFSQLRHYIDRVDKIVIYCILFGFKVVFS